VVRQDFACISSKVKNKKLDLMAEKSLGEKGTSAEQKKSLPDNTDNAERPDIVEDDATGEDDQGQASIFRHTRDQGDDERQMKKM
jgi:hypothetical protein